MSAKLNPFLTEIQAAIVKIHGKSFVLVASSAGCTCPILTCVSIGKIICINCRTAFCKIY